MVRATPSFKGLKPASKKASRAARGSSKKTDTKPEKLLRSALWKAGLRFRKNVNNLPGKPDIVFPKEKVAVFVDGDFWHGKNWTQRRSVLSRGNNASYWKSKITSNMKRDQDCTIQLRRMGWQVLRMWESDVCSSLTVSVKFILSAISIRRNQGGI